MHVIILGVGDVRTTLWLRAWKGSVFEKNSAVGRPVPNPTLLTKLFFYKLNNLVQKRIRYGLVHLQSRLNDYL